MTMNYGYNGRGERVHRHLGSDVTYSVYDEAGHWIGDYDASGAPKQQAIWLDDLPVGLLNGAATATNRLHYIEPDHLGTPRAVIEPQRDVAVWTWDIASEAFGNSAPSQDPDGDSTAFMLDMRFPGQRYDAATGLNYNYFRDYEAGVGRYAQSDPIGQRGGVNTYGYVYQNPIKLIDPKGLDGSPFCGGATGLDESINFPGCIDTGGPVSSAEDTACDNCIEYEVVRVLTRDETDRINTDRAHLNNFVTCPLVTLGAGRLGGALVGTAVATACNFSTTEYTRIVHEGDVLHVRVKICDDRPYEKEWSDYTTDWIEYR